MANLKAIKKQCERKQLATAELGEIMGSQEIADMQPSSIKLEDVIVNREAGQIEFIWTKNPLAAEPVGVLNPTGPKPEHSSWAGPIYVTVFVIAVIAAIVIAITFKMKWDKQDVQEEPATDIRMTYQTRPVNHTAQDNEYARFLQMNQL